MNATDVLNKILEINDINAKSLSEKMKLDRPQSLYDIRNGKTKSISRSIANKISSVFPDLNKSWILTGEGEMYSKADIQNSDVQIESDHSSLIRSIEKMTETADRNSRTLEKIVDFLINKELSKTTNNEIDQKRDEYVQRNWENDAAQDA
jgi:hypothetical protein